MNYQPNNGKILGKVTAATAAAAAASIVIWMFQEYGGAAIPEYVQGGIVTLFVFVSGYLMPIAPGEIEPVQHRHADIDDKRYSATYDTERRVRIPANFPRTEDELERLVVRVIRGYEAQQQQQRGKQEVA